MIRVVVACEGRRCEGDLVLLGLHFDELRRSSCLELLNFS